MRSLTRALALTLPAMAALLPISASAGIATAPLASGPAFAGSAVVKVYGPCPPGYHLGRGGQRCWPNGWAPVEEVPRGFVPPGPRIEPMPPVLECPPGYHLGRGLQRCWPN
ncbi:hypothetical protein MWN34_03705 [Ancylobacter sp. 6x-1]|uniref:Secreted protein n=1 Tax=Ancylobacter crimeensis TaxID=2579147 RepID=A0ABT0D7U4_9HYPH|nr:hypothetical protein [Ancylobacter crimeensis]MCK0196012.1 hypothetical protein [Ancylobacter crimeensis]